MTPGDAARILAAYAKKFHAGAFATPLARELEERPGDVASWGEEGHRTVVVTKTQTRASMARDFTATRLPIPAGSVVATHVGREDLDTEPPELTGPDYVMAYAEDRALAQVLSQKRPLVASRVTAAAELIHVWGPVNGPRLRPYAAHDEATVTLMPYPVGEELMERASIEVTRLAGWDDDFPYYSDGSWSALSLRGYWPDDPTRGVKPSEMPKSWKAEHPEDLGRECEWTTLAEKAPAVTELIGTLSCVTETQRVRLLRMDGRGGKGGRLGRHTDITDRDSGTRDGQITRFHLPIVTDPRIVMHWWDLDGEEHRKHLAAGEWHYLDARKPHAVTNPTGCNRVHLVVDAVTDSQVRGAIAAAVEGIL
jgi:hypothetical protein